MLSGIAFAAKGFWRYPNAWMEAWHAELTLTRDDVQDHPVWIMEIAGAPAGFLGLRQTAGAWNLEHLWLRPEFIGKGFGRLLFREAVRVARGEGAIELHIKSDPNAEAFYLRMGALRTGVETYDFLGQHRRELPLLTLALR